MVQCNVIRHLLSMSIKNRWGGGYRKGGSSTIKSLATKSKSLEKIIFAKMKRIYPQAIWTQTLHVLYLLNKLMH